MATPIFADFAEPRVSGHPVPYAVAHAQSGELFDVSSLLAAVLAHVEAGEERAGEDDLVRLIGMAKDKVSAVIAALDV
jgi:hypothetical protein